MPATTLTDRAVVRLSGEDVRGFVQGLVTSDVAAGLPVWTGLLTPQGKCLFDFFVWPDDQGSGYDLLLDCEAAAADDLIKRLAIYRLRRPIRIERDEPASGWLEHRLRFGVTEGRAELGDILWLECNAAELNGVSFTKGCFVGQENTARMNWRQKVNRRLVVVETGTPGPRTRGPYPELGLAVEHRRVDDLGDALRPAWLAAALAEPVSE